MFGNIFAHIYYNLKQVNEHTTIKKCKLEITDIYLENSDFTKYFDKLNEDHNIYKKTHKLRISTDGCSKVIGIEKFEKLKSLELYGCRWFSIYCQDIPKSIRYLTILCSNIEDTFFACSYGLENLETIHLESFPFFTEDIIYKDNHNGGHTNKNIAPIQRIDRLKFIQFDIEGYSQCDFLDNWKENISNISLFSYIKHNITDITFKNIDNFRQCVVVSFI
jgi:hypothetical protein